MRKVIIFLVIFVFAGIQFASVLPADAAAYRSEELKAIKKRLKDLEKEMADQKKSYDRFGSFMEDHKIKAGLRLQAWYQFVEDGKNNQDKTLNDFMLRRAYFYLKGQATEKIGFFAHLAADRIGQDDLDKPSVGLGSGLAVRDAWVYYNLNDALKFQFGRMYIPFTRFYGTESTFGLLTLDLPFTQGGVRGSIFYTSKVGRDDGAVIWGNPLDGKIQYRLGVSEGVESNTINPDDNLRFTGRLSLNLLEPETGWFNKGTYLGKKKVLAIGAGFDCQQDLSLGGKADQNNEAWTTDIFFDYPVGDGAVTAEAAYINLKNSATTLGFSRLVQGENAHIYYVQAGYLMPWSIGPGKIQPYARYEFMEVDNAPDTSFPCLGINYYIKGHSAKLTLDWTLIHQEKEFTAANWVSGDRSQNLITFQFTVGL